VYRPYPRFVRRIMYLYLFDDLNKNKDDIYFWRFLGYVIYQ